MYSLPVGGGGGGTGGQGAGLERGYHDSCHDIFSLVSRPKR